MAAQLMATNGLRLRVERRCSASATISLPEPVGPSISTGVMRGATRRTRRLISSMQAALPTSSGRCSPGFISLPAAGRPDWMEMVLPVTGAESGWIGAGEDAAAAWAAEAVSDRASSGAELSIAGAAFHAAVSVSCERRSA